MDSNSLAFLLGKMTGCLLDPFLTIPAIGLGWMMRPYWKVFSVALILAALYGAVTWEMNRPFGGVSPGTHEAQTLTWLAVATAAYLVRKALRRKIPAP